VTISIETLEAMVAAGATAEGIVAAIKKDRAKGAARQQRYRARHL